MLYYVMLLPFNLTSILTDHLNFADIANKIVKNYLDIFSMV